MKQLWLDSLYCSSLCEYLIDKLTFFMNTTFEGSYFLPLSNQRFHAGLLVEIRTADNSASMGTNGTAIEVPMLS